MEETTNTFKGVTKNLFTNPFLGTLFFCLGYLDDDKYLLKNNENEVLS